MTLVFNKKFTEKFRKQLRANQTRAEATLWHELRAHRLNGLKFRRQYSVNQYIIDFSARNISWQ